jgi:hypothetical protein
MGMRLRMTAAGQLRMLMRCSTCHQEIGGPARDAAANADANLFGAEKYVVCPTCRQVVPQDLRTSAYKAVWTRKNRSRVE